MLRLVCQSAECDDIICEKDEYYIMLVYETETRSLLTYTWKMLDYNRV